MSNPDRPPSLPSSSELPKIRITSGSGSPPHSPHNHSPRASYSDRINTIRAESLSRTGSNASSRSTTLGIGLSATGSTSSRSSTSVRARSPPPAIASHAGGISSSSFFRVSQPLRSSAPPPLNLSTSGSVASTRKSGNVSIPYGKSTAASTGLKSPTNTVFRSPTKLAPLSRSGDVSLFSKPRTESSELIRQDHLQRSPVDDSFLSSGDKSLTKLDTSSRVGPDVSFSATARTYGTKSSLEPLLNTADLNFVEPITPTSLHASRVRRSIEHVFGRMSVDSSDVEKGRPEVQQSIAEHDSVLRSGSSPAPNTNGNLTRSSSLRRASSVQNHQVDMNTFYRSNPIEHASRNSIEYKTPQSPADRPTFVVPHNVLIPRVPILNAKTGRPVKNHDLIPSKNTFFLGGRFLTGGDSPLPFIATLTLIFSVVGTWFGSVAPWWWRHNSHGVGIPIVVVCAYMVLFSLASLFMTASVLKYLIGSSKLIIISSS